MSDFKIEYDLSEVQAEYIFTDKVVNVIISNTGEGKTFASIMAMIVHAQRCGRPIRCAIVRDTHENIKLSTAVSITEFFEKFPHSLTWKSDFKQLTIHTNPPIHVDLFGIDDLGSLSKLQGPEYALIWLEEPAPMADKVNAGLSEEVFNAALVRCARQKGTQARLQVSMNPADEDHWTYRRFLEEPDIDPDNPLITKQVWFVPYGANKFVSETSRQAVKAAYKDDPAAYTRYVLGKFAAVYRGKKVSPEFNPLIHVAPGPLEPARGLVSFRYYDSWHNPTCGLGQITTTGRLVFLDTMRLEGGDIRALIESQVVPMINSPRWKDKAKAWRDIGDFSMKQPDQSNRQESAARAVEDAFGTVFEPGPPRWEIMKLGFKRALNTIIMGMPAIVVCPTNKLLIKGLSGAWHYKTDNSGNITSTLPEKDEISHVCDGWANGVNVLLPTRSMGVHKDSYKKQAEANKRRTRSYATGATG
jgi:hypothetical protein